MLTIYKYEILPVTSGGPSVVHMPTHAEVLSVGTQVDQNGVERVYVWVHCNNALALQPRMFYVSGTGHETNIAAGLFIGSVHFKTEPLVFHVFSDKHHDVHYET
jgi:hypothetical protein